MSKRASWLLLLSVSLAVIAYDPTVYQSRWRMVISSSHDTRRASVNPLDEGLDETFVLLRGETDAKV
jgi:hypothetical protein